MELVNQKSIQEVDLNLFSFTFAITSIVNHDPGTMSPLIFVRHEFRLFVCLEPTVEEPKKINRVDAIRHTNLMRQGRSSGLQSKRSFQISIVALWLLGHDSADRKSHFQKQEVVKSPYRSDPTVAFFANTRAECDSR